MKLVLDNIIFSLQNSGGASVVWAEHLKRLLNDSSFNLLCLEICGACNNVSRRNIVVPPEIINSQSRSFIAIKRYLDINSNVNTPHIFHSSHYRIDLNPNAKNVTTVHDFVYERYMNGLQKIVHSYQKWKSIRKSDAIICISESTKRDLMHYLPEVDENKIHIVYNGVNEVYKQIEERNYILDLPFSTREYALYVGSRRVKYKNFKTAVKICKETRVPLITVGGEPFSVDDIDYLDSELGKGRYASYRNTSNRDLNELYNRAFVLLYPSLYEGFGIPVIEAQRSGCPVLCIASSSIPEIVGDTNLCVTKESTIQEMCFRIEELRRNPDFRLKEIQQGVSNSKRFSWDKTYKQTIDIYKKIM